MADQALLKGFFARQPGHGDWPIDPEEACIKHAAFLKLWVPMGYTKPQARAAWKGAFPKMPASDVNALITGTVEARKWLRRKQSNMKTGGKTHPIIKDLLKSLYGKNIAEPGSSASPKGHIEKSASSSASPKGQEPTAKADSQESASSLRRLSTKTCPIMIAEPETAECPQARGLEILSVSSAALTTAASSQGVVAAQGQRWPRSQGR